MENLKEKSEDHHLIQTLDELVMSIHSHYNDTMPDDIQMAYNKAKKVLESYDWGHMDE